MSENSRGLEKTREGIVVSNKMDKTAIVSVTRQVKHPLYHKYVKKTNRYHAHDSENKCQVGDTVKIVETRPLSKLKRWRVQEVLTQGV